MAVNAEMLVRVLYKTATTFQYYDFVLLSQHIAIMLKSLLDFKISSRFSKDEDA